MRMTTSKTLPDSIDTPEISQHKMIDLLTGKSNSSYRIYVAQSSPNDKPPTDQFQPLQSVFRCRLLTGVSVATALAIGTNFGGIMSFLLGFSPDAAWSLKLDAVYPVRGYNQYIDTSDGFENWLEGSDATVQSCRDPPPLDKQQRTVDELMVAFGSPGSTGELNVSVIVSPVRSNYSIEMFGEAEEVGEAIVRTIFGKRLEVKGRLTGSSVREDAAKQVKYYQIEYEVVGSTFQRHNLATCCTRRGRLFTLNVQLPEST